ncbi:MAG: S-methyl-5-thioribose-1-phosphate isomerase [Planctomycetales bacterium]|nr:S-methyl-5-thioribose-1-phosphate isomerase [Planctomycetales bacterium]
MASNDTASSPPAVEWIGDHNGHLRLIDQTLLPTTLRLVECRNVETVWDAIKMLRVRGAPAIGIAAAYGVVLSQQAGLSKTSHSAATAARAAADYLATSRPTAVNLFWALDRMRAVIDEHQADPSLPEKLLTEAQAIHVEDQAMCRAIGKHGAALIPDGATLITHCNAGGLATAEYGTALSVMFTCQDEGKGISVYADETRPLWQGARLTAWELQQRGIPTTVICDSMAAHVMQTRKIDAVITGADRITARGDAANKIGTYGLAVVARYHNVPFYVAAPSSTFDMQLVDGRDIPIEQRDASEIVAPYGNSIAPDGIGVYNPAFDVTPAELITALITERGVIQPVTQNAIEQHFQHERALEAK